jgi:hypothetical protein
LEAVKAENVRLAKRLADSRPAYGTAPCGHDERFVDWEDHSRPIRCTVCEIERLEVLAAGFELQCLEARQAARFCFACGSMSDHYTLLAIERWPWLEED